MTLIDAHHHLWDLDVRDQPWLAADAMTPIQRSFGIDDLVDDADSADIVGTVVVQAIPDVDETRDLLDLAARTPLVCGVVGFVDLEAVDVGEQLDRLQSSESGEWLVGIRSPVQDEPDPAWLARRSVLRGLRAVAERDLAFDLLLKPPHLAAALVAATEVSEGRFVVDHLAKPAIASREWEPWASAIAALAHRENVSAKLSGLVTEANWNGWRVDDLQPYAEHALTCFGPDRILFGSDWPVCRLAATYIEVVAVARWLMRSLNVDERMAVFGGSAVTVYGLRPSATDGLP